MHLKMISFEEFLNIHSFTIFLAVILIWLSTKYYYQKRSILLLGRKLPGPKGWPLIGNALEFLDCDYDITQKINEHHKIYDLFALWIGHQITVCVKSPEDAETYCNSYKLIHRGEKLKYFDSFMGKGLLFAGGKEWKKAKKIMASAFRYSSMKHYLTVIKNETNILMQRLKTNEGKNLFLAYPYIRDCTYDIISGGAFEVELKAQKNEIEIVEQIELMTKLAIQRMFTPWQQPDFLYKLFKDGKMFYQSFDDFNEFFNDVLQKKMKYLEEERKTGKDKEIDGSEMFWRKLFQSENLSKEEMQHHYHSTIVTGFETTGNSICFILTLLGFHPDVQEKTYNELISVIDQGEFDDEKLQKLEYLERVILETLRLFPTVPLNSRKCTEDIQFGQYLVPAGSDVHLNIFALHRDPKQFQNPNDFNPDNFLPENVSKRHPYAFVPFSMGPRKCIGAKFAMMSMKIIVGTMIMKYKVGCDYKSLEEIPFRSQIHIKMTNDCPMRLLKR